MAATEEAAAAAKAAVGAAETADGTTQYLCLTQCPTFDVARVMKKKGEA